MGASPARMAALEERELGGVQAQLKAAEAEMQELVSSGRAFTDGWHANADAISKLESRQLDLNNQMTIGVAKAYEMDEALREKLYHGWKKAIEATQTFKPMK